MAHRGPDGSDVWWDEDAALGHLAFRSTPEALRERLPFWDSRTGLAITADARLDNREELLAALDVPAGPAAADSQIILAAYERWGRGCAARLLGDFSFVIRDRRSRLLFAARDHLGVRPFYYSVVPGRCFLFASEIKALLSSEEVSPRLNEPRIADYLADVEDDRSATFFAEVHRLPPAHTLALDDDRLSLDRYWEPDAESELELTSDHEYGAAFREVFERAVAARLRSSVPVGVSLSGGLDSCSVACVARDLRQRAGTGSLPVHSMRFDSCPDLDEREYVGSMIEQGGLEPHWVLCDELRPLDRLDTLLAHFEEPLNSVFAGLAWSFWTEVRASGTRVLLDGVDGDVTVSYAFVYLAELARRGRFATAFREAVGLSRHFWLEKASPLSIFWREALFPLLPRWGRWRSQPLDPGRTLVRREFAQRVGLAERLAGLAHRRELLRTARQYHCADVTHGVLAYAVEGTNKLTAALGLEPRHPFFDKRLVEFCISLPRSQRVREGWTRVVVRRGLRDLLPEKVRLHGDKFDAGETFARRLTGPDLRRAGDLLRANGSRLEEYVDLEALEQARQRAALGRGYQDLSALWRGVVLGAWLELLAEGLPGERR